MSSRRLALLSILPLVGALALTAPIACDTSIHFERLPSTPPDASASCAQAGDAGVDFAFVQTKILTRSCAAFSSCHKGTNPAGSLTLEDGRSIAQLVNRKAVGHDKDTGKDVSDRTLVIPGDPGNSYLMDKLGANSGFEMRIVGVTMPFNNPLLCKEKLEALRRWIQAGATDGLPDGGGADAGGMIDAGIPDAAPVPPG